jgi:trimethylamine--corrinoid protein Co-methyltransferase
MTPSRIGTKFLSEKDLERIEETAHRLLAEVGILLEHPEAGVLLREIGCTKKDGRVCIPREAVEWALSNVRPHRQLHNRDGSPAFQFGDGVRFHNAGGPPFINDLTSGERRAATLQDVGDITRLLDALPNVDNITPLFGPQDVPPEMLAVASTHAMITNTSKPLSSAAIEKPEHIPHVVALAAACCGGVEAFKEHPTMSISVSPISPLHFSFDVSAAIMAVARSGAAFHSLPAPSLGATAPITLAAALAQQHAEVLASFVIAAAAYPGALVSYCSRINPIDLRTAVSNWGGPEVGMSGACAAQLAHRLGFACDSYGFSSSASRVDAQFAYERLTNAFVPALAGVDILSGVGAAQSGMVGAHEIAVIDNEMIAIIKRVIAGAEVSDETLAFEVMAEVITQGQVFLAEEHTVRHMRRGAVWMTKLGPRGRAGEDDGGVLERARLQAHHILDTHQPEPLPEDVHLELEEILERAARELVPA